MTAPVRRPRAALAMRPTARRDVFATPALVARLGELADIDPGEVLDDLAALADSDLAELEVLVTGWGCPSLDAAVLERMPRLRAVVHTAGSVKDFLSPVCWERGIVVSSATEANALPVAEFTVAAILFVQKQVLQLADLYARQRTELRWADQFPVLGNYRRTVGIVGASRIGRRVLELLAPFDLELLLADPYLTPAEAAALGARLVGFDELFAASDTVSLHAPSLPETRHLVDRRRLARLRDGATLINTARGALVDTAALTDELVTGRIQAVLDVTEPEVLPASSPLYDLPNVLLTPHIAGSLGRELERLATHALDELERFGRGAPFRFPVLPDRLNRCA